MSPFTLKRQPKETGPDAHKHPFQSIDIRLNKQIVGVIEAPPWYAKGAKRGMWRVSFAVAVTPTDDHPSKFKWVTVGTDFYDDKLASRWVRDNADAILEWGLYAPFAPRKTPLGIQK
jgi:hypothetical protein